jgi:hypothetical protein
MSGDDLYAQVQRRLAENGEWDRHVIRLLYTWSVLMLIMTTRLLNLVQTKLNDTGALDTLLHQAKGESLPHLCITRVLAYGTSERSENGDLPDLRTVLRGVQEDARGALVRLL